MEAIRRFPRWTAVYWTVLALTVCHLAWGGVVPGAAHMDCPRQHFGRQVKLCLQPFWSVAALVTTSQGGSNQGGVSTGLAKQLCLQFEIALVCLHSALSQCPSHSNIQYVQSKLGSDWAMEIRNLCVGQSGPSTRGDVHGEDSTAALTQEMEPPGNEASSSSGDSAMTDEEDLLDDGGDVDKEILVLVPRDEFYHDIVVDVRQRAKLKPRCLPHHHRHHRLQGGWLRLPVIDIQVYSDMFDEESRTLAAKSAAATAATTTIAMSSLIVVTVFVMIGFTSPVVWF